MAHDHQRDWGFFLWTGTGLLIVFGFIAGFSIGLPFFYAGLIALGVLAARGPRWPAQLGLGAGAGISCLIVAVAVAAEHEPSTGTWALVGAALVGGSAFAFWWLHCRPGR